VSIRLELFILLKVVICLEHNEKQELERIKTIIDRKQAVIYNPFANMPLSSIQKALKLLEEYSEEF
jgi:hypothetical protein